MLLALTIALSLAAVQASSLPEGAQTNSRHKRYANSKVDLGALKDNLASIEDGLQEFQKRSCAVGINSHHCAIAQLDDMLMAQDYLSSGFSPGKRNTELPDDLKTKAEVLLNNLHEQMLAVTALRRLLSEIGEEAKQHEKRTCEFRLGSHCLTEALDRAANQYYYLQSPLSPGRRRRRSSEDEPARRADNSQRRR